MEQPYVYLSISQVYYRTYPINTQKRAARMSRSHYEDCL